MVSSRSGEFTFEGLEELAVLLFDPMNGRLVAHHRVLRHDSVWALHEKDAVRLSADLDGQVRLGVREEFPDPAGDWQGYVRRHYELSDTHAFFVHDDKRGHTSMVRVARPDERAGISGSLCDGVLTDDGHRVFSSMPTLHVPEIEGIGLNRWRVAIRHERSSVQMTLDQLPRLPAGGFSLTTLAPSVHGVLSLALRGPLAI